VPESDIAAQEICGKLRRQLRNIQFSIFEAEIPSSGRITDAAT